jgi:hypothetical protein
MPFVRERMAGCCGTSRALSRPDPAGPPDLRQAPAMTTPEPNETTAPPSLPEPRDIALEMETPEQAEEMEAQSDSAKGTEEQQ